MTRRNSAIWAILALPLLALTACGGGDDLSSGSSDDVSADGRALTADDAYYAARDGYEDLRTYPAEVRDNFVRECQGTGGIEGRCVCLLNAIENRLTLTEFLEQEQEMARSGEMPAAVQAATLESSC